MSELGNENLGFSECWQIKDKLREMFFLIISMLFVNKDDFTK